MRNLNMVAIECMRELEIIGIKYGNVIRFEVNRRAKNMWGRCTYVGGNDYIIEINEILLREDTDINGLKNTIIHELLHSCKDCMCHTGEWKRLAQKVNKYYGYDIKRCSSSKEKGISAEQLEKEKREERAKKIKHKMVCTGCGQVINRQRESNFTRHPDHYKCGICGGKFKKEF